MSTRLTTLRTKLRDHGLDAILVTQPENRRFVSGFTGSWAFLLLRADEAILATDSRYFERARHEAPGFTVTQVPGELEEVFEYLVGLLPSGEMRAGDHSESLLLGNAAAALVRLGFEADDLTFAAYHRLLTVAERRQVSLVPTEGLLEQQRMIKEPDEIRAIEAAAALTDDAYAHLLSVLRPGMTEKDAAWEVDRYFREHGGEGPAFETIVGGGPNAALPHHTPSDRPIAEGETVVVDMGARVGGYNADLTRTICFGAPSEELRRVYGVVLEAQTAAIGQIQSGMTGAAADGIARQVIEDAGFGPRFGHSLGHGVGLAVHEQPRLRRGGTQILGDDMVFTVEPGIYLPGVGGVRIEDTVVLKEGRLRSLSKAEKSSILGTL